MNEPTEQELLEAEDFLSELPMPIFTEDELVCEIGAERWEILTILPEGL